MTTLQGSVIDILGIRKTVTVSGSTTLVGTQSTVVTSIPAITGSVSVISIPAVTGSVTLIKVSLPSSSSNSVSVTGATANIIVVPSHATLSVYLTDLGIYNGGAAGNVTFAQTNTATAGNIKIQPMYFAANDRETISFVNPIKLSATTDFVATTVSMTTTSILATYFLAA